MDRSMHKRRMTGAIAAMALASLAAQAQAQSLKYGSTTRDGGGDEASADAATPQRASGRERGARGGLRLSPYIEAAQVVGAQLSPDSEVLAWTALAAGVDGGINGRNSQGSFSIRYEHRFGWGKAASGDQISGLARAAVAVVPQTLSIEAGALATRTRADGSSGVAVPGGFGSSDSAHLYSLYAGPTLNTQAGDVALSGAYRVGYTEVGSSETLRAGAVAADIDTFEHSLTHNAQIHAGLRPGDVLPIGVGLGAGYIQEDVSNLDQRVKDKHARADVIVPVSPSVALVGGVGYEDVEVSSRDVLRDANGLPVRGADGRLVTDKSQPRKIAYDSSGFIWDAGITWRPSSRTALEAHVGRRYGSTTYYGSFGWRASRRSSLSVSVYDSISGFGGQLNRALVALPTDFEALRNPATGDINGCVNPTGSGTEAPGGTTCLTGALGSLRSAVFRSRGVQGSYSLSLGRIATGLGAGYDRRKFIAAPGTVLASANGVVDENIWLAAWLSTPLDQQTSFSTYAYANWFHSRQPVGGDGTALGLNALLSRDFGSRITGTASAGIQGVQRDALEDDWQASALLGLRYSFF